MRAPAHLLRCCPWRILHLLFLPVGSEALAVFSADKLFARLPAEARARVAWAQKPIRDAAFELRTGKLSDEAVRAAAVRAWPAMLAAMWALWEHLAHHRDELRAAINTELQLDQESLERFVDDDDTRDTIAWLFSFLKTYMDLMLSLMQPGGLLQVAREEIAAGPPNPELLPFLTGQLALLAATDEARQGKDRDRARDLLDIAFLEHLQAQRAFQRIGLWITPFVNELPAERGARALRYAEHVRRALAPEDAVALGEARIRELR